MITIKEMDTKIETLIQSIGNHKISTLHRVYKSIEHYPNHQRDLVVNHLGYKAVKRSNLVYTDTRTKTKLSYQDVVKIVNAGAEQNHKIREILKYKSSFSKVSIPQKKMILNYLGVDVQRTDVFHFIEL